MIPTKTTHESRSVLCWPHLARLKSALVVAAVFSVAAFSTPEICAATKKLEVARIYFEYNASANDLGVHVFLDGEDWKALTIANPDGDIIFDVEGTGPYSYRLDQRGEFPFVLNEKHAHASSLNYEMPGTIVNWLR